MSPQTDRGFTLIELLVVMVIIAIIASIAVISVNVADRDPAKEQAQKLADLAGLAAEQAVMQGQEYGLRIEAHAYTLYSYDGRAWQPVKDDSLFYRRELGDDVNLSLQMDGAPATLAPPPATVQDLGSSTTEAPAAATGAVEQSQNLPQVLLLSSGEMPAFEIDVTGTASGAVYKVKGSLADGITVTEPEIANAQGAAVSRHSRDRGFTLLEVLVAIVVVATGLLAVSSAAGNSSRNAVKLRDDTFAQWVGLNELTMLRVAQSWPNDDSLNGDADMAGEKWHWKATMTKTADPGLLRVDIDVTAPEKPDDVVVTVTGFMGLPPNQQASSPPPPIS